MSWAHGVPTSGWPVTMDDSLSLVVGGQSITGWQRVMVTRPLAGIPASFSIEATERYPNASDVDLKPGQPCVVMIGGDLVLTGYVDRYIASISAGQHTIRIDGRSKSMDLVDCSALVRNGAGDQTGSPLQLLHGTTDDVVRRLAATYNISVQNTAGPGRQLQQFNINLGETSWDIINRITRYSKMIVYDLPDGSIMLAKVGTESMASGFQVGANVEQAGVMMSMDQRYSEYEGHFMSFQGLGQDSGVNTPTIGQVIRDEEVPRFRKLFIVSEQYDENGPIAGDRAAWEKNHRWGQSFNFNVTCDSWRDAAGRLWEPNRLAPIDAPQLKLVSKSWLIGTVTYLRDENGQHTQLGLWPPEAFSVEPTGSLYQFRAPGDNQINNPTKPNADAKIPT